MAAEPEGSAPVIQILMILRQLHLPLIPASCFSNICLNVICHVILSHWSGCFPKFCLYSLSPPSWMQVAAHPQKWTTRTELVVVFWDVTPCDLVGWLQPALPVNSPCCVLTKAWLWIALAVPFTCDALPADLTWPWLALVMHLNYPHTYLATSLTWPDINLLFRALDLPPNCSYLCPWTALPLHFNWPPAVPLTRPVVPCSFPDLDMALCCPCPMLSMSLTWSRPAQAMLFPLTTLFPWLNILPALCYACDLDVLLHVPCSSLHVSMKVPCTAIFPYTLTVLAMPLHSPSRKCKF
jgi:hypothetical protein